MEEKRKKRYQMHEDEIKFDKPEEGKEGHQKKRRKGKSRAVQAGPKKEET